MLVIEGVLKVLVIDRLRKLANMLELVALFSLQMTLQLSLGNGLVANPEGPIVDRRVPRFSRDQSAREKRKLLTRRLSFGSPYPRESTPYSRLILARGNAPVT